MKPSSSRVPENSSAEGWVSGGAFLGSILSGTLIGYLADRWLGTDPWLVVIGIVVGSYSGFMRMWQLAKQIENPKAVKPKAIKPKAIKPNAIETAEQVVGTVDGE